jgi:hypothetical protein
MPSATRLAATPLIVAGALLLFASCKRTEAPPRSDAPPPKLPSVKIGIRGRATPLAPLELGPLSEGNLRDTVDQLARAHYDPLALGLTELGFEAELVLPKRDTRARGRGSWRKGGHPEITLQSVTRKGKTETSPSEPGIRSQIWDSLRLQLQNLLEGLGRGFLSERLEAWRKLEGRAALKADRLLLSFSDEGGTNEVTVGAGYLVERVVSRSPKRVTRSMEYRYEQEGGRNRVTSAIFRVEIEAGADLPPRAVKVMGGQDGMRFELGYATVGGYRLPVKLRKVSPKLDDEIEVTLRYHHLQ